MIFEFCLYHYYFQSYRYFYDMKSMFFCPIELRFSCDLSDKEIRIYLPIIELLEKFKKWHDPQVIPDVY